MTMRSLRDRFSALDRVPVPDLWSDVERRAAGLASADRVSSVTIRRHGRDGASGDRTVLVLVAAALLLALSGALAVAAGLLKVPKLDQAVVVDVSPPPVASPLAVAPTPAVATPTPTATATPSVRPSPWIVFVRMQSGERFRSHTWAMRADGTGAHEIVGGDAWSPDGTRLLANDGHLRVAEVSDDIGAFVDTGVAVPDAEQWEAFDIAPDDRHVVFVRKSKCAAAPTAMAFGALAEIPTVLTAETAGANCYVLSTVDLATGKVTDLRRTLVKDQTGDQNLALELPAWSPDGSKIAYTRLDETRDTRQLWLVNADGSDPSRVEGSQVPTDISGREPRWSPDGTRIAFTSQRWLTVDTSTSVVYVLDLATGELQRASTASSHDDHQLCCAAWVDDSHLRVQAADDWNRSWVVDLDHPDAEPVQATDLRDALAAIDPPGQLVTVSSPGDPGRTFRWQPVPEVSR